MAGVSRPTVERAEAARALIPSMNCDAMARIIRALETAGVTFSLPTGRSLAGGIGMRLIDPATSLEPTNP